MIRYGKEFAAFRLGGLAVSLGRSVLYTSLLDCSNGPLRCSSMQRPNGTWPRLSLTLDPLMKRSVNTAFFAILIFATGCGDGASSIAKSDSSIITPLAENWPITKDGIVVNWLGNMVINDKEYFPFNKFATGFMKDGNTTVSMHLNQPPIGFGEIQIVPAIRLRRADGNAMYEVRQLPVRIGSRDAISCNITLSSLPIQLQSPKNGDLIFEIGYYYDDKYKKVYISNIPIL